MKTMKKLFALIMALAMVMALAVTVSAEGETPTATTKTGTITVTNAAKGEKYAVVKLFDATYGGEDANGKPIINYTGDIPEGLAAYFKKDDAGNISATDDAKGSDGTLSSAAIEAIKTWAEANKPADAAWVEATGKEVKFENLAYGYYVILSTQDKGAVITVDSTTPNAKVIDKNTTTPVNDLTKTVDEGSENVAIGDTVTYTVKFGTANYNGDKPITEYVITDTLPAALTNVTVTSIKVGGTPIETQQFENKQIKIKWANEIKEGDEVTGYEFLYANGAEVEITYTAVIGSAVTEGEIKNEVTVSNNQGDTDTNDVTIETAALKIKKYDGADQSKANLAGAVFQLLGADDSVINLIKVSDTEYRVALPKEEGAVEEFTTVTDGDIVIKGLDKDVEFYKVKEITAPEGYNGIKDPIDASEKATGEDGAEATVTLVGSNNSLEVANNAGTELPSTGGIGTTIFTVVGATLMIGAAVLFVTKKRTVID